MRSCLAVQDTQDGTLLAFVQTLEVHARLQTVCDTLYRASKVPTGAGSAASPFVINSFGTILGFIDKRRMKPADIMHFTFFGVAMYQNGNNTTDEKDFYIGLRDEDTLSYPDMREAMAQEPADPTIRAEEVKAATGIAASNRIELLAIACLFVAEGRRDVMSLVSHLLLCDLITDQVKYGSGGNKTRSLASAVDKGKDFSKKYTGVTAAGDSPMSQKGAVAQAHTSNFATERRMGHEPAKPSGANRYFNKTVSLLAQWFAAKYSNPNYVLAACRPEDEVKLASIDERVESFLSIKAKEEKKKKSEKAWQAQQRGRNRWQPELQALKTRVLAELSAMLKAKVEKVAAGEATGFVYDSQLKVDTKVLKEVLV